MNKVQPKCFISMNPATEAVIAEYPCLRPKDLAHLVQKAHKAAKDWAATAAALRIQCLVALSNLLEEKRKNPQD